MKQADEIVVEELEQLLDQIAPHEADLAASYVRNPAVEKAPALDKAMGIPGGDMAVIVGPLLMHFLCGIAVEIYNATRKVATESLGKRLVEYLSSKFHKAPQINGKVQTIDEIASSLRGAGWTEQRALEAAFATWSRGEQMAKRLDELN